MSGLPVSSQGTSTQARVLRWLGPWDLAAIGVNGVIGAGIFILPATVAQLVGTSGPLAYLFSGIVVFLIALCFAEIGSYFTASGGPYLYARKAFGPFVGFEVGWVTWLVRATSTGAVCNALVTYLGYFWPGVEDRWNQSLVMTSLLVSLTLVNLCGVRYGAWVVNFLTLAKLLPLAIFIVIGSVSVRAENLLPLHWPSVDHFGEATLLLIFAYGGFEIIAIPAEEAKNPRRHVPKAILITMSLVTILYISIQIVASGTFSELGQSKTPLASACAQFLGPLGGTLMTLGALVSTSGTTSGLMLTGPRLTYALAQHRQLPAVFERVHRRFHTPYVSVLFFGLVTLGMTLSGTFVQLAALAAIARLLQYIATCLALLKLRRVMPSNETRFQIPFGPSIPVFCVLLCTWLILQSTLNQLFIGLGALLLGALLYGLSLLEQKHA